MLSEEGDDSSARGYSCPSVAQLILASGKIRSGPFGRH